MKIKPFHFILVLLCLGAFFLACRTANLLGGGNAAEATPTRARATRAAQRATFTPIPTETDTPEPTLTPEPTFTPEPTETPEPTRRPPTRKPPTAIPPTNTAVPATAQPTATPVFEWALNGNSSCEGGGDNESSVSGKITNKDKPAVGQRVQASSGPGGEPISENPAETNKDGNFKVTFICGGKACNGDFYIWMVNAEKRQVSPFVKFHFDGGCRKGKQNFQKRY